MPTKRIQGEEERSRGIYYEYDPSDQPLGEGGMGKVYRGWCVDEYSGRQREVAIKFLYSDVPNHVLARARREASVRLRNDNLVEMLGFVEMKSTDELGRPVVRYHVVSEFLHGVTLSNLLDGKITDYRGEIIPFAQELHGKYLSDPYHFALIIIRNLLSGLMALHDAGYIHRDIDPSNIMITADGHIKLIDFGIAKRIRGVNTSESTYTVSGQFIGKPKYAAPELVRGLTDSQGVVTDIYAVGILLFQLVTGHLPFDGEMAEVLEMQTSKPMPLSVIRQKALRNVIRTATRKNRAQRYQSAAEFRVAVERLVPLVYPEKRVGLKWIGATAASVAVCLLAGFWLLGPQSGAKEPRRADPPAVGTPAAQAPAAAPQPKDANRLYAEAVGLLRDRATAGRGLELLYGLRTSGDPAVKYRATFLLSRLCFRSEQDGDVTPDSILLMQRALSGVLSIDNRRAHELLKEAVAIDSTDYRSLYEIGCDYKSKGKRGAARNTDLSRHYLDRALELARKAGDLDFQRKIRERSTNL